MFEGGPLRFGELRKETMSVSQKTLTRHLRDLERNGLVTRTIFAEVPPRVEYELTGAGLALALLERLAALAATIPGGHIVGIPGLRFAAPWFANRTRMERERWSAR